jgi:hypothetical protein
MAKDIYADPRISVGAIVRGNEYAKYGITYQGSLWVVYKVTSAFHPIHPEEDVIGKKDILIGPDDILRYKAWLDNPKYASNVFPVTAARFNFHGYSENIIALFRNKMFIKNLQRR